MSAEPDLLSNAIIGNASAEGASVSVAEPIDTLNTLLDAIYKKYPEKGLGASSSGKFNDILKWLTGELGLSDWKRDTYAVGSAGTAHNFTSRWVQNRRVAGTRRPLGAAFLSIPAGEDEDKVAASAPKANLEYVDGSQSTSFEAVITFVKPHDGPLRPYAIQSTPGNKIAERLLQLFPGTPLIDVDWKAGAPPSNDTPPPPAAKTELKPLSPAMLLELKQAFAKANYQASDDLAGRVIGSLAAKPFLLLAGLSGTGKTLLALALSRWMAETAEQVRTVAVGADWTSAHHLMGYPDALDSAKYVRTPALELLLRAKDDLERPYFLILDEMNLSHVERYFSDFLSAMESDDEIVLHGGGDRDGVPPTLAFPQNLFVIGTVNVDETTYMFSPKVIDRANVIEFTVGPGDMKAYLAGVSDFAPAAIQGQGAGFGAALADTAASPAGLDLLEPAVAQTFRDGLLALFEVLDRAGLQFGFRTAREIIRYLVVGKQLHGEAWSAAAALDAQLVQRLLPRLNGDGGKLRPPLLTLLAFCSLWSPGVATVPDVAAIGARAAELAALQPDGLRKACGEAQVVYPLTADKLARMLKRLAEQGFITAIEA